ncbi:Ribonuclease HI [Acidithiobacillus caldus SM-1]|uniref:ribonuclease H n=1 Tax=Acidithiobacillus caldus (strain SM-1) TaxID=990288 RepID=F9ZRT9_ACICS|nr:Ribonuclease HI [Acidithiobacillus caldus SM-1]
MCLRAAGRERVLWGYVPETTNNRMEMTAVLRGLQVLRRPSRVQIVTDSRYLVDGMTQWLPGWLRRGWRSAAGAAVKNRDLWQALQEAAAGHELHWQWVRGHAGHPENEAVDALINRVLDRFGTETEVREGEGWL